MSEGRVSRAGTPPRDGAEQQAREVLWLLSRGGAIPVRAELVALVDAVELEIFRGSRFRRRWRFIRDAAARQYAARLKVRLVGRGFRERRRPGRTSAWLR